MNTKFADAVIPHITLANALAWDADDEKFLWVVYNVLDQIGWPTTDAAVNWIEDRFQELIEDNIEQWADSHMKAMVAATRGYHTDF